MGAGDGMVQEVTKLLDSGSNDSRFNIVLVAEGFQNSQQGDFNNLCNDFLAIIQAEPWFPALGGAINIHRLNVASNDSGADDPASCGDGSSGSGASPNTFFDATFCSGGMVRRCVSGNQTVVNDTLDTNVPHWHVAAVIVNSTEYGGCRTGDIIFTSINGDWENTLLHELGHAIANLADEYDCLTCTATETGHDHPPAGEPMRPNITANTSRATLKWRHLVTPEIPIPTMTNADCTKRDTSPNVLLDDLQIGLFEGAGTFHCDFFRPAYECRMRNHSKPFCRVCLEALADRWSEFMPPTPTLEVAPNFLEFGNVAHGLTLYRAFEVRNVRTGFPGKLTVTLSAAPAGFSYAPGTETTFVLPAPILETSTSKPVFVAFTSSPAGGPDFAGSLQVTAPGSSPATVDLHARAVPPPPVDSVLVIDRSDSMSGPTGVPGKTKVDLAIEAANLYTSLLKDNDRIGLVRYNDHANNPGDVLLTLEVAGDGSPGTGRGDMPGKLTLANLDPDGFTSIGGGILLGSSVLDAAVANSRAIVVLTDGIQNRSPDIPDATATVLAKTPRQRVFAIGLGLNQLEDKLHQIATVTNGVAQITGDIVGYKEFLLQKLYVQILSDASDEAFVTDPLSVVPGGQKRSTNVYLGEVDVSADFIIVFRREGPFPPCFNVWLEAPNGKIITPADAAALPNVEFFQRAGHLYFRWEFPAFPDDPKAHIGRWRVWVENLTGAPVFKAANKCSRTGPVPLYYSVMCKARSDFRLGGHVLQENYEPGSSMTILLEPTLYGEPVRLNEPVRVQVFRPDNVVRTVKLARDADGIYRGPFTDTPLVGPYLVIADVSATTPAGKHITRYRQMTGLIFRPGKGGGGDHPPGGPGGDECKEARELIRRLTAFVEKCCAEKDEPPKAGNVGLR